MNIPETPIIIQGPEKGPNICIIGGVHGDETCGIEALTYLSTLTLRKGTLTLLYGNPKAIELRVRATESNLNRMFVPPELLSEKERSSYEFSRAQYIKNILRTSDILLDIHASTTPLSTPFIICEKNGEKIVKYFPFPRRCYGFDSIQPGGTDYYMNRMGKIGICIECGYLGNPEGVKFAIESAETLLSLYGMLEENVPQKIYPQQVIQMEEMYLAQSSSFTLAESFSDFALLKKGALIGEDGKRPIMSKKESLILFPQNTTRIGAECYLLGKELGK